MIMAQNSRGMTILYFTIAFGVIDTMAVALRLFSRKKTKMGIAVDDWMIVASLVPAYGMIVSSGFCWSLGYSVDI